MSGESAVADVFCEVIESGQRLVDVEYLVDRSLNKGPVGVRFRFEKSSACAVICPDDDTIQIAERWTVDECEDQEVVAARFDRETQHRLQSARLLWCWTLTNQQGYTDGIQLEFKPRHPTDDRICIQLLAVASTLDVRLVSRLGQSILNDQTPR